MLLLTSHFFLLLTSYFLLNGYASAAGPSFAARILKNMWSGSLEDWRPGGLEAWGQFFDRNLDKTLCFLMFLSKMCSKPLVFQGFWKICAQNHWFFNDSEGPTGAGPKEFALSLGIWVRGDQGGSWRNLVPHPSRVLRRRYLTSGGWRLRWGSQSLEAWMLGDLEPLNRTAVCPHKGGRRINDNNNNEK